MPAKQVRSDYDQLKGNASSFRRQEEAVKQTSQKLKAVIEQLNGGQDWVGHGATAFYQEMESEGMPARSIRRPRARSPVSGRRSSKTLVRVVSSPTKS